MSKNAYNVYYNIICISIIKDAIINLIVSKNIFLYMIRKKEQ